VIAGNNNVVKAIINGVFTDDFKIDTGTCLSFLDNVFVQKHGLHLDPLKPGMTCVYMSAGKTKIRVIGTTCITLSFGNENFVFKFQVVNNLSVNILLGMDFILNNNCVPFANKQLFSLVNGRVWVPMGVGVSVSDVAEFGESRIEGLHLEIKDNSVSLKKPLQNAKVPSPVPQGDNHALILVRPQASPAPPIT